MKRWTISLAWLWLSAFSGGLLGGEEKPAATAPLIRVADQQLQIAVEPKHGSLRELTYLPDGENRLEDLDGPFSLWEIDAIADGKTVTLAPAQGAAPRIEPFSEGKPGLRLTWDGIALGDKEPLQVVAEVRLDERGSCWELAVHKPREVKLKEIRFPRVPALKPYEHEVLAIPILMGRTLNEPRSLLFRGGNKNARLAWSYPYPLSLQCLADYEPHGPGWYVVCDDEQASCKRFTLWGDAQKHVHMEVGHLLEEGGVGEADFRLPYPVILSAFRGDWSTVAERYRELPAARALAERGRLRRQLVPDWVTQTGLWVWNRGRSEDVLLPATLLQKHTQVPVSVLWHWWHDCAYDAGFPEYLPPREGTVPFQEALQAAQKEGLHAILYMNQRLWGTTTASWKEEQAERYAVKGPDGQVKPEVYNTFMQAPCAPMCIGTEFWRNKYAALAREALCNLKADGVYMDQVGVSAACYDPQHGHPVGVGRYWFAGLEPLTTMIRERCSACGPMALGGEYCIEPAIPSMDMFLALEVSNDRHIGQPWEVIPFTQAVYHPSVVTFGNFAGLVYPPYDERWPAEKAPPLRLTSLDRKFSQQFRLEQARTFVWGMQPMIANFRPELLEERAEELDYVTRLVRTRQRALKYLLHGTWLSLPVLQVPEEEIDVAKIGTYTPLAASKRSCPVALAAAWRAEDGEVGIALASIANKPLPVSLPIDFQAYGLGERCSVYCLDASGRRRLGTLDRARPVLELELPPEALWVVELCRPE